MTARAVEIVERARSLIGVPFRPQGRDPATGLDCVGLVLRTFAIPVEDVRRDYRLRGVHRTEIEAALSRWFAQIRTDDARPGDLLLFTIGAEQIHLGVSCGATFVHSDASLRQVVERPLGDCSWARAAFRKRSD